MTTPSQLGRTASDGTPPNVVVIVFDDVGFAQLGTFGSDIATPNIDRLAAGGLRYNAFHVTALCSPTRASLLTGRNHHAVSCGFLADVPLDFPGYTAHIPPTAGTIPRVLRDAGYSTMAAGKWHLVPGGERSPAGPFDMWPLGLGFERFYGFLQGDTNQWTPNLVADNHYVDPPREPSDGYHFTEDMTDSAIAMVMDQQAAAPGKPFFLYFAPGAMHAPHQVAPEWVAPYAGRFDQGWDRWREDTFRRQVATGVVPEHTVLTERPPWLEAWTDLDPSAARMHARAQEVYAGFLTHTDAQIGRLIDSLERLGVLDDTIVMLLSDNGASAEGGRHGTFNEHRFSSRLPETVEGNLAHHDDWGGFRSYNHYSWAWAWAGNTPFRLWKRYTWLGGTRTPLVVHWPAGIEDRGAVRPQFCHAVDIMPTILDVCAVDVPKAMDGFTQQPLDGCSFASTFDDASTPAPRSVQYFEMLGSRSIIDGRWKATTDHVSQGVVDEEELMVGSRDLDADRWSLFDLETDFSEATDVADTHPETVHRLEQLWWAEAGRNNVLPIFDGLTSRLGALIPRPYRPGPRVVLRPGVRTITDEAIPVLVFGFRATVDVDVDASGAAGVVFAMGDWNGGYSLYAVDGHLHFTLCAAGEEVTTKATSALPGGRHSISVTYTPGAAGGLYALECDGQIIGSAETAVPFPFALQHGGARFRIGYDRPFPVCDAYTPPAPWRGVIHEVVIETPELGGTPTDVRTSLHSD